MNGHGKSEQSLHSICADPWHLSAAPVRGDMLDGHQALKWQQLIGKRVQACSSTS